MCARVALCRRDRQSLIHGDDGRRPLSHLDCATLDLGGINTHRAIGIGLGRMFHSMRI